MMNRTLTPILCLALFALFTVSSNAAARSAAPEDPAAPLGTAFTYQGRLDEGGDPVNGAFDFRFILYDAAVGGAQVGSTLTADDLAVSQGYFTAALDFGASAFNGQRRWLEVSVRPGSSSGDFTTLSPRQALTPAPYALYSRNADRLDGQHASAFSTAGHNHLGETWTGSGAPLVITGTFGSQAAVTLSNSDYLGTGLVVNSARDGVEINALNDGLDIYSEAEGIEVITAEGDGVRANTRSQLSYGGVFRNLAVGGSGLLADGGDNFSPDVVLGATGLADDGRLYSMPGGFLSSDILLVSRDAILLQLDENNDEAGNVWVVNGTATTVLDINENGDLTAAGTKSAAVTTQDYGMRKLYALESPQNWFEDFGSAQLVDGAVTIAIEPVFAQTVNLNEAYHVFLTPLGDCPLYVAEKTPQGFTVRAMGGQACSIAFDYRIVAKRLGYESLRLEPADDLVRDEGQ